MGVFARIALAVGVALPLLAGCDGTPSSTPTPSPTTSSVVDPALTEACAEATKTINDATTTFTTALAKAVAAGEGNDTKTQAAAVTEIKAAFADWSSKLRAQAERAAADPELRAALTQYAAAVDAVIARVKSAADLDKLSTFDNQEIEAATEKLVALCGPAS